MWVLGDKEEAVMRYIPLSGFLFSPVSSSNLGLVPIVGAVRENLLSLFNQMTSRSQARISICYSQTINYKLCLDRPSRSWNCCEPPFLSPNTLFTKGSKKDVSMGTLSQATSMAWQDAQRLLGHRCQWLLVCVCQSCVCVSTCVGVCVPWTGAARGGTCSKRNNATIQFSHVLLEVFDMVGNVFRNVAFNRRYLFEIYCSTYIWPHHLIVILWVRC